MPIAEVSRKYLRFVMSGVVYQFRALCFGLSSSPQVFTMTMKPVIKVLHMMGIRVHHYIDDWLCVADTEELSQQSTQPALRIASELGLRVNLLKSVLVSQQQICYLGMWIDLRGCRWHLQQIGLRDGWSWLRCF